MESAVSSAGGSRADWTRIPRRTGEMVPAPHSPRAGRGPQPSLVAPLHRCCRAATPAVGVRDRACTQTRLWRSLLGWSPAANVQMFRECFLSERPSPCRGGGVPQAQSPAQHPAPHHCESRKSVLQRPRAQPRTGTASGGHSVDQQSLRESLSHTSV